MGKYACALTATVCSMCVDMQAVMYNPADKPRLCNSHETTTRRLVKLYMTRHPLINTNSFDATTLLVGPDCDTNDNRMTKVSS